MKQRSTYWQLLPYIQIHKLTIASALLWMIIFTAFWPLLAWLAGQISRYVGSDVMMLCKFAIAGAVVYIFQGFAQYWQNILMAKAALRITLDLRQQTYKHLLKVSMNLLSQMQIGDISYRITEDIDRIGETIKNTFQQFIPSVLQLVVVLGYMIFINWQLTLIVLILAPVIATLVGWFGEKIQAQSLKSQNKIADLSSLVTEDFSGINTIQSFVAEDYVLAKFGREAEINYQSKYITEKTKSFQYPILSFLQVVSILFVFVLAGWQISIGNLTTPRFVSYLTNIFIIISPIAQVTASYNELKQAEASADRIFELNNIPITIVERPDAIDLTLLSNTIEYRHVSFGYNDTKPILQDFNLTVRSGETIALVGASGAGKSTILSLLNRFYDVTSGRIAIDGIDIRDFTLTSLRRQIGIVPQDTILFSGNIAQNIALGHAEFDIKAVETAAKIANAHQFISELSQGYYTYVGQKNTSLSGGQKQRIAIARAIFSDPQILILDEATSALDSESEALVQEALERVMVNRTVFIIAHRLATVRKADRILTIENGKIIEAGTHTELIAAAGRYSKFYTQQFS